MLYIVFPPLVVRKLIWFSNQLRHLNNEAASLWRTQEEVQAVEPELKISLPREPAESGVYVLDRRYAVSHDVLHRSYMQWHRATVNGYYADSMAILPHHLQIPARSAMRINVLYCRFRRDEWRLELYPQRIHGDPSITYFFPVDILRQLNHPAPTIEAPRHRGAAPVY